LLSSLISHCDSAVNWVVVSGDFNTFILVINDCSLLHFEAIRISPENTFWIKIVIHFPVDCHIFAQLVSHRDGANFNVKLNQILEKSWRVSDSDDCTAVLSSIIAALESD